MAVATVTGLWRYPVKSMQGHEVDRLTVTDTGIEGDRTWGLIDRDTGALMSAKRWPALLDAAADDEGITLPDGRSIGFDDAAAPLSTWLGREVELRGAGPDVEVSYEMTLDPPNDDAELFAIPAPPGTFLDLAGAHLVSTATLAGCAEARPDLDWDVRRFRPNLVVDGLDGAFAEDEWCGRRVRIGGAVLVALQPTVRCAMPLRAQRPPRRRREGRGQRGQPGLDRQPDLYRALDDLHANHLGIYLDVAEPGGIAVGDPVEIEETDA